MKTIKVFSPESFVCDTSVQTGVVEQTTTWLAMNPIIGCPLECAYCFRHKWGAPNRPVELHGIDYTLKQLLSHPLFVPHEIPLTINISSTDAMLPSVKPTTFEYIRQLDSLGYKNIFGITTKLGFSPSDIEFLTKLRNLRFIALITYSEMPHKIEPVPTQPRIDSMRMLKEAGLPVIHYYRPIVPGWNDDLEKIEKVLSITELYANAITTGGLRLSPEIRNELDRKGIEIPFENSSFFPKLLPEKLESKLYGVHKKLKVSIPLYKHTSCAVSYVFRLPNYNALFLNPTRNCVESCPASQRIRCGADY